jgi:hypothetical protein
MTSLYTSRSGLLTFSLAMPPATEDRVSAFDAPTRIGSIAELRYNVALLVSNYDHPCARHAMQVTQSIGAAGLGRWYVCIRATGRHEKRARSDRRRRYQREAANAAFEISLHD